MVNSEPSDSGGTGDVSDANGPRLEAQSGPDASAVPAAIPGDDARVSMDGGPVREAGSAGEGEAAVDSVDGRVDDAGPIDSSCTRPPCLVLGEEDAGLASGPVPRVRTGTSDVQGSSAEEVVRRIVRRHISEIRCCYERALEQTPDLEGRITVAFIISPTGVVQSASVASSDLDHEQLEACIVDAVRCWTFYEPEDGGTVTVTYPFVLQIAGE